MKKKFIAMFVLFTLSCFSFAGISIKLTGGLGTVTGGDWNKGIDGWNSYFIDGWSTHTGSLAKLGSGMDFSGELIFNLSDHFGVGIGGGYFQVSSNSQVSYSGYLSSYKVTWNPTLSAIPIVLNLHLKLPLGKSINFHVSAGAGCYMGKFDFKNDYDDIVVLFHNVGTETWTASKGVVGFQGAVGIDFKIASKVYLGVEIGGRYASLKDLTGDYLDKGTSNWFGDYVTQEKRTLWSESLMVAPNTYNLVLLSAAQPAGTGIANVSKANVSLTGFSAKVGLRFDL